MTHRPCLSFLPALFLLNVILILKYHTNSCDRQSTITADGLFKTGYYIQSLFYKTIITEIYQCLKSATNFNIHDL